MSLFEFKIDVPPPPKSEQKIKLKKGQTIDDLIKSARDLVMEKLGDYKDLSKCVIDPNELREFFKNSEDDQPMAIDTETTGLNTFTDEIVGLSLCNRKRSFICPYKS